METVRHFYFNKFAVTFIRAAVAVSVFLRFFIRARIAIFFALVQD